MWLVVSVRYYITVKVTLLLLHWSPSTRWRLCQRLYYFYHTLITFNKMTIMSEVVLLLLLHWSPSTRWRLCQRLFYCYHTLITLNKMTIMSEVVLLLPYTDHLQQDDDYVRGCSTATIHWSPSTRWRLCQRLFYCYHTLITLNKMTIMSEVVLLLPYTDHLQQVEDYVRGCTTSTKYWPRSTSWKLNIMSEVVLLLPNTDRLQQDDDYVRGCSNSTKYWPPSTRWRLCQKLFYCYQILTAFNILNIMSEGFITH
jgi:uncharacterized protein (DUF1499 family)